jgi:SpoVK/Ycf46/Vps4 family AAA+-type ATPase
VYGPVVDYTGYSKTELHLMAKALFMPEGKTSLTELNREELREYTEHVERWLREECADAYGLMEPGSGVH